MIPIVNTSVFACVSLAIVGLATLGFELLVRRRQRLGERFKEHFRDAMRGRAEQSPLFKDLQQLSEERAMPKETLRLELQAWISQAGVSLSVSELGMWSLTAGCIAAAVAWPLAGRWWCGLIAAPLGALAPLVYVHAKRQRRITKLCRQLPEAFDVMSRALRAGQSMTAAFQVVANDFPAPIAEEFSLCYEQQHLGVSYEVALRDLAQRTGILEVQIFVVALIVTHRAGGNLAELLSKLARLVRQRIKLRGRVKALTGEGRMQAAVLLALPIVVLFALLFVDRDYAQVLFDRPKILLAAGIGQAIGALWIRKIIHFEA